MGRKGGRRESERGKGYRVSLFLARENGGTRQATMAAMGDDDDAEGRDYVSPGITLLVFFAVVVLLIQVARWVLR